MEPLFTNPQITTDQLPTVSEVNFQQVAPAYVNVSYIGNAIFFTFLLIGLSSVLLFSNVWKIPILYYGLPVVWIVLAVLSFWLIRKGHQVMGYALRERDVLFRKGVLFFSITTIPFNRVQHCEIQQGPVERIFGLSSLEIFTAGGQSSDLKIPGLRRQQAEQMKSFIMGKTTGDENQAI